MNSGTNSGPELLLELDRAARRRCAPSSRTALREAVRSGRLPASARLPATRALAGDLGVSRRLVVDAYAQLLAEGYLRRAAGRRHLRGRRRGAGERRAAAAPERDAAPSTSSPAIPTSRRSRGGAWLRALRETLREAPDRALGYPDPRGAPELRRALAAHLRRVRGVVGGPRGDRRLLRRRPGLRAARARARRARAMAVEDPGLPAHRAILAAHGATLARAGRRRARRAGARARGLGGEGGARRGARHARAPVADRRGARRPRAARSCCAWAGAAGGLVDRGRLRRRVPLRPRAARRDAGARARPRGLHGHRQQDARARRCASAGWCCPRGCVDRSPIGRSCSTDHGSPDARPARARAPDRGRRLRPPPAPGAPPLPRAARRARARPSPRHLPGARVTGLAAGLHAIVRLPRAVDGLAAAPRRRGARSVGVYPLGYAYMDVRRAPRRARPGLRQPRRAGDRGGHPAAGALARSRGAGADAARARAATGPAPTNDGGAIAR